MSQNSEAEERKLQICQGQVIREMFQVVNSSHDNWPADTRLNNDAYELLHKDSMYFNV